MTGKLRYYLWYAPQGLLTLVCILFGTSLVLDSTRWYRTPAYGMLLTQATAQTWGTLYLFIAFLLAVTLFIPSRFLLVMAHLTVLGVLTWWFSGFTARYFSDSATTPVTAVMWFVLICLDILSMTRIFGTWRQQTHVIVEPLL